MKTEDFGYMTGDWDYGELPANIYVGEDCWLALAIEHFNCNKIKKNKKIQEISRNRYCSNKIPKKGLLLTQLIDNTIIKLPINLPELLQTKFIRH